MKVRTRVTLVSATAMTGLAVLVAGALFFAESRSLIGQADIELTARTESIARDLRSTGEVPSLLRPPFGVLAAYAQLLEMDGTVTPLAPNFPQLPFGPEELAVASGSASRFFTSTEVETVHLRVLTIPLQPGIALQVARPVDAIDLQVLRLTGIAFLVGLSAAAIGVLLGRWVARSALKPVAELTEAARLVASTHDLAHRIDVAGDEELVGLAESMNSMVVALDEALRVQQQLVADASHELQTPITVLRTNVAVLQGAADMDPEERRQILSDMAAELINLGRLATNLVDLARDPRDPTTFERVEVAEVVDELLASAHRTYPGRDFHVETERFEVDGDPDQIRRMVRNLIDNAAEWSGPGGTIGIQLRHGVLTVSDNGPGIPEEDLPHIFDRFYRSTLARALPGSGLGLAIVAKAVSEHGWEVVVANAERGGAIFEVHMSPPPPDRSQRSTPRAIGVSQ